MSERSVPGLGLTAFWSKGSDSWKPGMDENLRKLSILSNIVVLSRVTALSDYGQQGDVTLVPGDDPTHPGAVAAFDNGEWVFYTARKGWRAYVLDESRSFEFDGTEWLPDRLANGPNGAGIEANVLQEDVALDSGAQITATIGTPHAGTALVVHAEVLSEITGPTSISIGTGGANDLFMSGVDVAQGTANTGAPYSPVSFDWGGTALLTVNADDGDFTGGTIRLTLYYLACVLPDMGA